jgi:hypothetical protein
VSEEELKAFRNLNTFSTKYIVNKKASSENDIATMFIYIAKLEVELEHKDKEIERLNNIINRFEKDLKEVYLTFGEFSEEYTENRIKELKGEDKE